MKKEIHQELLNEALTRINTASEALKKYYEVLEDKIKLLTEEVEQKKRLLSSILDSIDIGVVFFDSNDVIRLINKAGENLFNLRAEEVIGRKDLGIKLEEDKVIPNYPARPFYAIVSQSDVFDSDGNKIGHVLICKDITRIKELEAESERNRRLTAMGSLIMKIAHEIRNPLGSIELFANMIAEDIKEGKHGEYARRISSSVSMLRNTLENMLSFTKGINPNKENFCLNDLINEVYTEFKELCERVGIRFNIQIKDRIILLIDPSLLRQALVNLIVNAYQAMPEGGEINIKADVSDKYCKLTIKDTGQGIDSESIERIFEPFFSTKDRGTGLGLSITHSIINAHGGRIEVSSKKEEGTEFAIYLPIEK